VRWLWLGSGARKLRFRELTPVNLALKIVWRGGGSLNTHSKIIVDVINNLIEVDFRLKMEYVRGLIIGMSYQSQRLISFSEISGPGKIGNRGLGAVLTGLIKADFAENRPITSALVVNPSLRPGDGFF
jgi:hypothetical protein